ncbi:MAG: HPr family phosphocarrier protein [Eubacteriales bacterium]|nr:HPr family phosphocarrier protein [Eubacteriales bacterium]
MKEFQYKIKDGVGIHARPAGLLVKEAEKFLSDIQIKMSDDRSADAKRLFALMGLGAAKDDVITVSISGEDEEVAAAAIKVFLEKNL